MTSRVWCTRVLTRLALLACLLVALLPAGRTIVVCIDGQWNFALEAASEDGTCSDCSESAPCSGPDTTVSDASCDCTDLVIGSPTDQQQNVAAPCFQVDVPPASLLPVVVALPPQRVQRVVRHEPPRPPGTLRALRTIVLLV